MYVLLFLCTRKNNAVNVFKVALFLSLSGGEEEE